MATHVAFRLTRGKELAAEYGIDGLRPVIMKLEATDEESKIACERQ